MDVFGVGCLLHSVDGRAYRNGVAVFSLGINRCAVFTRLYFLLYLLYRSEVYAICAEHILCLCSLCALDKLYASTERGSRGRFGKNGYSLFHRLHRICIMLVEGVAEDYGIYTAVDKFIEVAVYLDVLFIFSALAPFL